MIDKAGAIPNILSRLKKMPIGYGLDLKTFKRDRSVVIMKITEDGFKVAQRGFATADLDTDRKRLRRLLKTLLKMEFPRSNKIRVSLIDPTSGPVD